MYAVKRSTGSSSAAAQASPAASSSNTKRPRASTDSNAGEQLGQSSNTADADINGSDGDESVQSAAVDDDDGQEEDRQEQNDEEDDIERAGSSAAGPSKRRRGSASSSRPSGLQKKKKKTLTPGIVYISRVPPGMTPQKVRHLMARWGEVGKVYAQAKDGQSVPHRRS